MAVALGSFNSFVQNRVAIDSDLTSARSLISTLFFFFAENGSQSGLQGLGDEVDGGAWPDWAASLPQIAREGGGGNGVDGGGLGDEDSSDGEEVMRSSLCSAGMRPSQQYRPYIGHPHCYA